MTNSSVSTKAFSTVVTTNREDVDVCGGPNVVVVRRGPESLLSLLSELCLRFSESEKVSQTLDVLSSGETR